MAEPIGTALTVAGNAASKIVTPKLREKLLGPLFDAYGQHWGEEAEERLKKRREERRVRNIERHIVKVANTKPRRSFDEVAEDIAFDDWLEGASLVNEEVDPDLADFWRAALASIAEGDASRVRLLRIVKSFAPDDAVFLATGSRRGQLFRPAQEFADSDGYARRMMVQGVFLSSWDVFRRNGDRSFSLVSFFLATIIMYFLLPIINAGDLQEKIQSSIGLVVVGFVVLSIAAFASTQFRRIWHITPDGLRLFRLLDRIRLQEATSEASAAVEQEADVQVPKAVKRSTRKRSTKLKEEGGSNSGTC